MGGNETVDAMGYTFQKVYSWEIQIPEGIWNLDELYISINKKKHWMTIRVMFPQRRVEVWDYLRSSAEAHRYMANVLHYTYDALALRQDD